jgi:hypothetical protein
MGIVNELPELRAGVAWPPGKRGMQATAGTRSSDRPRGLTTDCFPGHLPYKVSCH